MPSSNQIGILSLLKLVKKPVYLAGKNSPLFSYNLSIYLSFFTNKNTSFVIHPTTGLHGREEDGRPRELAQGDQAAQVLLVRQVLSELCQPQRAPARRSPRPLPTAPQGESSDSGARAWPSLCILTGIECARRFFTRVAKFFWKTVKSVL